MLAGIAAAKDAGLAIKINMVALKGVNEDEIVPMMRWCAGQGCSLTLIETMPLGEVEDDRSAHYLPLDSVKRRSRSSSPWCRRWRGPAGPPAISMLPSLDFGSDDYPDQRQFLHRLQPHPGDRDRNRVRLSWA